MMPSRFFALCSLCIALCASSTTIASTPHDVRQFARDFSAGAHSGTIIILGYGRDAQAIGQLMDMATREAEAAVASLDWQNPASDLSQLNAKSGKGPQRTSDIVLTALDAATKTAGWTRGAFDPCYASAVGDYRDIAVNVQGGTVALKKSGMHVRVDPILDGIVADLLARFIFASGMQHAMVRVGNVFRGIGSGLHGPWKIQVADAQGGYAQHAMNLTINNTGIATISANQFRGSPPIDGRRKSPSSLTLRGATVVQSQAALAQGLAYAAMVLGPQQGMDMLTKLGNAKALLVDASGRFLRTPGF